MYSIQWLKSLHKIKLITYQNIRIRCSLCRFSFIKSLNFQLIIPWNVMLEFLMLLKFNVVLNIFRVVLRIHSKLSVNIYIYMSKISTYKSIQSTIYLHFIWKIRFYIKDNNILHIFCSFKNYIRLKDIGHRSTASLTYW